MVESVLEKEKISVQSATSWEPAAVSPKDAVAIYVVDDEPTIGELVATLLEMEGFQITQFTSPVEALKAFVIANPRPALLLTDFTMGDLNGMQLIDHCKRAQPTLKTILCSGNVGAEVIRGYPMAPDCFIPKPFHPRHLVETVRLVLAG